MKRGISLVLGILCLSLVSAGLSDFLYEIELDTLLLMAVFLVALAIFSFSFARVFRKQKTTGIILAFVLAILATYWVNKADWDIETFLFDLGIKPDMLYIIIPIIILAGIILLFVKLKAKALLIIAVLLFILSLTNLIYGKSILLVISVVLFIIGLWLVTHKPKAKKEIDILKKKFAKIRKRNPKSKKLRKILNRLNALRLDI